MADKMLDFAQFQWLSFDCYGTLIDWESGILGYLRPLLRQKGCAIGDAEVLSLYSEFEPREQSGEYRSYREVLASVVRDFARELRFDVTEAEAAGLADSIRDWEPFADTVPALRSLHSRYKLAILSNIDDDLFAHSARKLQVSFDCVVTAQQAHSYKPSLRNFEMLLERLATPRNRLLHVGESLYHDVGPARSLGIATVWVNRRQGKASAASKLTDAQPDMEVADLRRLADLAGC
ncbi:MAG: haloacid dehalogenase type II [Candidatus Korobacteraceae bacterium]